MYVVDGVGVRVRPEENMGVAGMRIYCGSTIFRRFEVQKMTFVIVPYQPEEFLFQVWGGVKMPWQQF